MSVSALTLLAAFLEAVGLPVPLALVVAREGHHDRVRLQGSGALLRYLFYLVVRLAEDLRGVFWVLHGSVHGRRVWGGEWVGGLKIEPSVLSEWEEAKNLCHSGCYQGERGRRRKRTSLSECLQSVWVGLGQSPRFRVEHELNLLLSLRSEGDLSSRPPVTLKPFPDATHASS